MKALKTIITALLFAFAAIFAAAGMAACGNKNDEAGYKIVLDRAFPEGNVINYAEEIELPSAHVENAEGETVSYAITYRVTGENGFAEESEYSSFSLAPAKYTAVYVYSEKLKLEIEFTVIDSENPVIKFTNVPNDVFLGETDGGFLPTVEIEDASEVSTEKRLYFAPYGGENKEVSYNKMNDSYAVTEAGVFTFTVKAEDESGNSAENSVSWLVKDPEWTDESLENGYHSDFGEEGYLNTVRSADVNVYWNAPEYSQEWLESYEGAGGVVKLGLPFTVWNFTAIRIRLSKPISWNELRGKYIAVRVFVEGEGLQDFFAFAGNQKIQFETEYSAATERKTPLITGKWTTYYLDYERAKALRMYSDENDDKDSPVSPIKELQFAFGRMNNRTKSVNLYIDGVSVAEKLPAPENLRTEKGKLCWNAVQNAISYTVDLNGEISTVTDNFITLPDGKGYIKVSANGDGFLSLDSEANVSAYGLYAKDGEYASFDDELYTRLIDGAVNVGSETEGYKPSFVNSAFEDGRIKITVGKGAWGVCSAVQVRFPQAVTVDSGVSSLCFGMTASIGSECKTVMVFTSDYKYKLGELTVEDGKTEYVLDISGIGVKSLSGIQFVYVNKLADGKIADMGENVLEFTLDYIAPATPLGKTEITADTAKRTIYWNAVENAVSYAVVKDGEKIASVTGLSYDCSSLGVFDSLGVYAEGSGRFTDGEIAYAEITLSGDVWVTIKGIVSVKKVAYSTDGLLQLELNETTDFAENAKILTEGLNIILNGEKLAVTGALWTNVSTKINISCDLSATTAGARLTVNAGTLFVSESGDTYKLSESYEAIFVAKSADGSIHWHENAGALKFDTTDYSATGVIQFLIPEGFNEADQQTFNLSLMNVTANGEAFKVNEIRWHASPKKLAFEFNQPAATAAYPAPTIVIEKGSVIFSSEGRKAYIFEESCALAYGEVYGRWSLVHKAEAERVSWSENAGSVQLILTEDCKLVTGETLDTSAFVVTVNGKEVKDLKVVADSEKHIHLYGTFSTESAEGYETPTLVIKAGSVAMLRFTAITFAEDVVLSWNGSAWVKA